MMALKVPAQLDPSIGLSALLGMASEPPEYLGFLYLQITAETSELTAGVG